HELPRGARVVDRPEELDRFVKERGLEAIGRLSRVPVAVDLEARNDARTATLGDLDRKRDGDRLDRRVAAAVKARPLDVEKERFAHPPAGERDEVELDADANGARGRGDLEREGSFRDLGGESLLPRAQREPDTRDAGLDLERRWAVEGNEASVGLLQVEPVGRAARIDRRDRPHLELARLSGERRSVIPQIDLDLLERRSRVETQTASPRPEPERMRMR